MKDKLGNDEESCGVRQQGVGGVGNPVGGMDWEN